MNKRLPENADFSGSYETIPEHWKTYVQDVVSYFHFRDCTVHEDGSWGSIKITPGQLRDVISYILFPYE